MTPDIYQHRAQFYEALRSDRFKQTHGTMCTLPGTSAEAHCCLSVAMVVAGENGCPIYYTDPASNSTQSDIRAYLANNYNSVEDAEADRETPNNYWSNCEDLHPTVVKWYGFNNTDPKMDVEIDGVMRHLGAVTLNDEHRWNFHQIADAFETNFPSTPPVEPEDPQGAMEP